MYSLCYVFVALVVSHFGYKGRTLVLIASVPGHCLPFTFFELAMNVLPLNVFYIVKKAKLMEISNKS